MNISDRQIQMKIQSAFPSIINLLRLFVSLDYQQYPISSDYRTTTVKTIFHQFSFPDDLISQNTIRKRYIKNEQELSIYVGIS